MREVVSPGKTASGDRDSTTRYLTRRSCGRRRRREGTIVAGAELPTISAPALAEAPAPDRLLAATPPKLTLAMAG
jgi:hypothetical protein